MSWYIIYSTTYLSSQGELLNSMATNVSKKRVCEVGSYKHYGDGKVSKLNAIALTCPKVVLPAIM